MKFRKDFVTNSSSSSFIAVFGTSTNTNAALESAKANGLENYVVDGKELLEKWDRLHRKHTCNDWCWADPFPDKNDIDENKLYFVYSDCIDVNADEDGEIYEDEVDEHYDSVTDRLSGLEGFNFEYQSGSGRNG